MFCTAGEQLFGAWTETREGWIGGTNAEDEEGVEKMDIPFRRVVALTAMGLVTGALLRLIYEALWDTKS